MRILSIRFVRITTHSGILHCGRVDDPPLRWGRTFLVCSYIRMLRHPALREGQDPPLRRNPAFMEPPIMRKNSTSAVGAVINRLRYYVPSPETPPANPHPNTLSRGEGALPERSEDTAGRERNAGDNVAMTKMYRRAASPGIGLLYFLIRCPSHRPRNEAHNGTIYAQTDPSHRRGGSRPSLNLSHSECLVCSYNHTLRHPTFREGQ